MCTLDSEVFVGGYSEHSRFSIYMWVPENKVIKKINPKLVILEACPNSKKAEYKDVRRPSLKTVGCTKKWHIQLIKPNPHVKNQIFVAARNDIMRVNVEMWKSHYVHPNDIIFRGKSVITDFKLIDNVHLIVMVSNTVYLIDQFSEQPLAIRREIPDLAIQRIILSPSFELDNLPLMIYNGIENEIKTLDIQSTGVTSHILLQRPLSLKAEITPNESGQQAMFIGQDDYNRFRIVTLSLNV
ncbi:hypothetical protein FGO68_gene2145 [Halteria grandinella]|uniref:Uncharacterized protein n=1 Tax=Halteria grandinella TaxID=5974 RepID=A0A8J8T2U3_HALGN|nr:hypothetical protein FGO68_gene2145 [Halteria grandinella]